MPEYCINPDFVVPDPTPADRFCFCAEDEFTDEFRDDLFRDWREAGVKQCRITIVNEKSDESGYPHGVWIEGWHANYALMLPFGSGWPTKDSAIWPPLTASVDTLPKGQDRDGLGAEQG